MFQETIPQAENNESERIKKILLALAKANGPAPLGYISLHTGIEEPLEILAKMDERDLVRRGIPSTWSCSRDPAYEITPAAREGLYRLLSKSPYH